MASQHAQDGHGAARETALHLSIQQGQCFCTGIRDSSESAAIESCRLQRWLRVNGMPRSFLRLTIGLEVPVEHQIAEGTPPRNPEP